MLPLCRRLRQRTLHQLLRYNQRGFRRKIRGRRYLPHAEGLRRYLKICDFRGNTLRRLDTELRHGQLRALQGRPQHHHFFVVSIPVIIALGAFICVLVIKRCFRPLAPIKDSLSDIRTFLSGVFSEISEAAGAVYSGANNVYQGANELAESASRQTAVVEEISGCVSAANSMISESSGLAAGRPRLSAKLPSL